MQVAIPWSAALRNARRSVRTFSTARKDSSDIHPEPRKADPRPAREGPSSSSRPEEVPVRKSLKEPRFRVRCSPQPRADGAYGIVGLFAKTPAVSERLGEPPSAACSSSSAIAAPTARASRSTAIPPRGSWTEAIAARPQKSPYAWETLRAELEQRFGRQSPASSPRAATAS